VDYFDSCQTHSTLCNVVQERGVFIGKMHGYMRMHWTKKDLEWTVYPRQVMEIATGLNNKCSLDGRDPDGYAGIV